MLPVALAMMLAQTGLAPAAGPIAFPSVVEPLIIENGAIAWRNPDSWVAWVDRRRAFGQPTAPLDVWVGQWNENAQALTQVSSRLSGRLTDVKLAVSAVDSRLYAVRADDAGVQVITTSLLGGMVPAPILVSPLAINGIAVAAVDREFLLAVRGSSGVTLFREGGMVEQVSASPSLTDLRVTGTDGGFLVSFVDTAPRVTKVPLGSSTPNRLAAQLPLTGMTTLMAPVSVEPPAYVTQDGTLRLQVPDGGIFQAQQLQPMSSGPLLVGSVYNGAFVVIANRSGALTVPAGAGLVTLKPFDAGTPLGLAMHDSQGVLLASSGGAATLRNLSVSSTGAMNVSNAVELTTMAPQRAPTVIWSSMVNQFLVGWEQRSSAGFEVWLTRVARDGSIVGPQKTSAVALPSGHPPRLLDAPDGGDVVVQLRAPPDAGFQTVFSRVDPTSLTLTSNVFALTGAPQVLFWPTPVEWTSTNPASVVGFGPLPVQSPRCVAAAGGATYFTGIKSSQFIIARVPAAGATLAVPSVGDDSPGCAAVGRDGRTLVAAARAAMSVHIVRFDALQGVLDHSIISTLVTGDPVVTALADGFLVAWPSGQSIVAYEGNGPVSRMSTFSLDPAMGVVSDLVAAPAPTGEALVAWHAFDLDGGTHAIWARVVSVPGAPAADAGVDAGVVDAGVVVMDAGVVITPTSDAGVVDAGGVLPESDAGFVMAPTIKFVPVCGCSAVSVSQLGLLVLVLALARRRGREAARDVFR